MIAGGGGTGASGCPPGAGGTGNRRPDRGAEKRVQGRKVGAGRLGLRETDPARNTRREEGSQVLRSWLPLPTALPTPQHTHANQSPKVECGMFIEEGVRVVGGKGEIQK